MISYIVRIGLPILCLILVGMLILNFNVIVLAMAIITAIGTWKTNFYWESRRK